MRVVAGIVCLLLGMAALGLLVVWIGRIYYFSGSASETVAQLKMLGTEAIVFGGALAALTVAFVSSGAALLMIAGESHDAGNLS